MNYEGALWKVNIPYMAHLVVSFHRSISLGSYGGLNRKSLEIIAKNLRYLKKRPLTRKFSKFYSERINHLTDPRRLVHKFLCKFREIWSTVNR